MECAVQVFILNSLCTMTSLLNQPLCFALILLWGGTALLLTNRSLAQSYPRLTQTPMPTETSLPEASTSCTEMTPMNPRTAHTSFVYVLLIVIYGALLITGCASMKQLESTTLDRTIAVDGSDADWQGAIIPVEDKDLSMGLRHDDDFLYLALITRKPEHIRQMVAMGMTVWFDPKGGKDKHMGIRFPLGLLETDGDLQMLMPGGRTPDVDMMQERFAQSLGELEIVYEGEAEGFRTDVDALQRVEVAAVLEGGMFIYELKMPLRETGSYDYAIGLKASRMIGIGVETPELDREAMREQMMRGGGGRRPGGGMGGGGMPGGGMGGGMPGGGMGPGGMPSLPSPVKLWVQVTLSDTMAVDVR